MRQLPPQPKPLNLDPKKSSENKPSLFRRVFRSKAAYFIHNNRKAILPLLFVALLLCFLIQPLVHALLGLAYSSGLSLFQCIVPFAMVVLAFSISVQNNPMHSLMSLISLFLLTVMTYLFFGAEYLGLVFLVVYVGAVAILFLFVVMLIPFNGQGSTLERPMSYFARVTYRSQVLALLLGLAFVPLLMSFVTRLFSFSGADGAINLLANLDPTSSKFFVYQVMIARHDIFALSTLYSTHAALFMLVTLILLIAMIGAIVLASPRADTEKNCLP